MPRPGQYVVGAVLGKSVVSDAYDLSFLVDYASAYLERNTQTT